MDIFAHALWSGAIYNKKRVGWAIFFWRGARPIFIRHTDSFASSGERLNAYQLRPGRHPAHGLHPAVCPLALQRFAQSHRLVSDFRHQLALFAAAPVGVYSLGAAYFDRHSDALNRFFPDTVFMASAAAVC